MTKKVYRNYNDILSDIPKADIYCKEKGLKKVLLNYLEQSKDGITTNRYGIISKLRIMFAEISVEMLQPDFFINSYYHQMMKVIQVFWLENF